MSDQHHQTQVRVSQGLISQGLISQGLISQGRYTALVIMVLMIGVSFVACGKKPAHLDPPEGVDDDTFLQMTYPDVTTDPKPTVDPRPDLAPKAPPAPERF